MYAASEQLNRAEDYYRKALDIHQQVGNRLGQANQLGNLGDVYLERGDLDNAEEYHNLEIYRDIDSHLGQAKALGSLGLLAQERGELDEARTLLSQAKRLGEEIGAGGPWTQAVRQALDQLEAAIAPEPKRERALKKPPPQPS